MSFRVAIISIGNEILLGRTLNTNLAWLAEKLALLGLSVTSNFVIRDEHNEITKCISTAWEHNDVVICTGGLGPTQDDITKDAVCEVFGT
jgi:nicotinamide-nucleotide amidase